MLGRRAFADSEGSQTIVQRHSEVKRNGRPTSGRWGVARGSGIHDDGHPDIQEACIISAADAHRGEARRPLDLSRIEPIGTP